MRHVQEITVRLMSAAGESAAPQLRAGTAQDAAGIRALLEGEGLPSGDLERSQVRFLVACDANGRLLAAGGLQRFGETALLRSLVVAPSARGRGIGRTLVGELERTARAEQAGLLVLLTLTAGSFFEHAGYRVIERDSVPEPVKASEEFRSLCPGSALCMAKSLA